MNAYLIISSFLVSVVTLFFLISVLLKGLERERNRAFCLFATSVFIWSFSHMLWQMAETEAEAVFWLRILVIGSSFIPYTYLHFVSEVTENPMRRLVGFGYCIAVALSALAWTPYIFSGVEQRMTFSFWPIAGPVFSIYFGGFSLVVTFCFFLLIRQYRDASAKVRNQNKYLIIGAAIGFLGGVTNFPLWLDIHIAPLGHGLSIFYILGIGYSVLKYRLLDFNEMVVRILGLLSSSALIGGLTAAALSLVAKYSFPALYPRGFSFWWTFFGVQSLAFLLVTPIVIKLSSQLIQMRLISNRFSYRSELRKLSDTILTSGGDDELLETLVERIYFLMSLDYVGLFIRSELESGFACKAAEGDRIHVDIIEAKHLEPLIHCLNKGRHAVFLDEEIERSKEFETQIYLLVSDRFPIRSTDVFVSISAQDTFYGFMILGSSRNTGAFSDVDLLLLENLCSHLGLTIKVREVERMTSQVEKLVSLGTMAAGLSHELRNPLVSVRTLASLLRKNPEHLQLNAGFSSTVQRDIKRITGIVEGVSTFAQNSIANLRHVDLLKVINETIASLQEKFEEMGVEYEITSEKELPDALGDFEQLIQVVQNILENALNAISEWPDRPEKGRLQIMLSRRGGGRLEKKPWVEIKISDNGPGMSPEYQKRIFDPFVTSRDTGARQGSAGTGLGLAIVNRIIERHHGLITVKSELGSGAEFIISLPSTQKTPN
jgi:two-component system nitrogen regulation sensor histidine kinase GlnL